MRDYNYRKRAKYKEQLNRQMIWNSGYFPSMPYERIAECGAAYYMEGGWTAYKYYKRSANKAVRQYKGRINEGSAYKRHYELEWSW